MYSHSLLCTHAILLRGIHCINSLHYSNLTPNCLAINFHFPYKKDAARLCGTPFIWLSDIFHYLNFLYPLFFRSFTFALRTFAEAPLTLIFFLHPLKDFLATFFSFAFTVRVFNFLQFANAADGMVLMFLFRVIAVALDPLNALAPIAVTL